MTRFLFAAIVSLCTSFSFVTLAVARAEEPQAVPSSTASQVAAPDGAQVIARVGDQDITYGQLSTMINSSAMVGVSVPALGTPQRDGVMIVLLDKMISANLLYLDALGKGMDKDPVYQRDMQAFTTGMLALLYRNDEVVGKLKVSEEEIAEAMKSRTIPGKQISEDARPAVVALLHKRKYDERIAKLRQEVREGIEVSIEQDMLKPENDALRDDSDVVAHYGSGTVTWGDVKAPAMADSKRSEASGGRIDALQERIETVNQIVDARIMADKARALGLDKDPTYLARYNEYRKSHMTNLYRDRLLAGMSPSEEELDAWFAKNGSQISVPEQRKVQMVVVKSRDEAEALKAKIEAGELTMFQAAEQFSIDPRAKQTLGDMGWVAKGTGFPELDKTTFSLVPGELGGPVQSPAGWHLVKVLDVRDAQYQNMKDDNTRKLTRRAIMHKRLNDYVVNLRLKSFSVSVDQDRLNQLFRQEAQWVASLEKKGQNPGSLTEERTKKFEKLLQESSP